MKKMMAPYKDVLKKAVSKFKNMTENPLTLNKYVQQWVLPADLDDKDLSTFLPVDLNTCEGIELNIPGQLNRLKKWKDPYTGYFNKLREDPKINLTSLGENHLHNSYYPTPDAEIYTAMILDYQPSNIIEIGSGFSTIIAKKTVSEFMKNHPCEIISIDPQPRADITGCADKIIYKPVEAVILSDLPINKKTLVFIDSSHITRARGDIPYLFNQFLPALPSGALVHVHDIFIPYDYPYQYQKRLYTEQYVLQALMTYSNRYKVVLTTHLLCRQYPQIMQETISTVVGKDDLYCGASFWFSVE